ENAVAAPPSGRSLALCRRRVRPQLHGHGARPWAALPLEKGRPHRRRPLPLAPALQRRPEGRGAPGARAHVRLDPRDHARAHRPAGAVRGSRGHAAQHAGGVADRVAGRPSSRELMTTTPNQGQTTVFAPLIRGVARSAGGFGTKTVVCPWFWFR